MILLAALFALQPERLVNLSAQDAARRMHDMRATWTTASDWTRRARRIRVSIWNTLDLPAFDPEWQRMTSSDARGPLDATITDTRTYDGYVVEDVSFRTFDGSRLAGNLYRPASGETGPGFLCPHGHFGATADDPEGRFRRDMQLRCATLARMGAVVFTWDMVGWGESDLADHHVPEALPMQTWNSVRAVDYLLSRSDVDPDRIGVTGASGGGSQSFLISALDRRVSLCVPCVMVSSHFFGGCECETGLPLHSGVATNNVEVASIAAPDPLLLISCGGDWTSNTPEIEYPAIQEIYEVLGHPERVENAHFASEQHDYGPNKRQALYAFVGT
ncbi:MAG: acetylxylan esterase, partial [Phycisphaerales bacterium]|nr:acetylxylan esterase [Phycisphaerales bacterium]